jgi:hypothetical protein
MRRWPHHFIEATVRARKLDRHQRSDGPIELLAEARGRLSQILVIEAGHRIEGDQYLDSLSPRLRHLCHDEALGLQVHDESAECYSDSFDKQLARHHNRLAFPLAQQLERFFTRNSHIPPSALWRQKPAPGDRRSAVAAGTSACATSYQEMGSTKTAVP